MIINTGSRTDIPAFFHTWFYNRIREGYVLVRNPYQPQQVTRYLLDPAVVDVLSFCSKNPAPMLPRIHELDTFRQLWHVTITPYGRDIEPYVPTKTEVLKTFRALSEVVGKGAIVWRYDPVFLSEKYSLSFHKKAFRSMAAFLRGSTGQCVVSFIDLYEKTKRNFPQARTVSSAQQEELIDAFDSIAAENGMQIHLCCESSALTAGHPHTDAQGCFSQAVIEKAAGIHLSVPSHSPARKACACLLGGDIGAYNTCLHGCRYCYANYDRAIVEAHAAAHDPESPYLIGHAMTGDIIKDADQKSWIDRQMNLFDFL